MLHGLERDLELAQDAVAVGQVDVRGSELLRGSPAGYADRAPRPARERAVLITPPSLVAVLRAGWEPIVPLLHPSALAGEALAD